MPRPSRRAVSGPVSRSSSGSGSGSGPGAASAPSNGDGAGNGDLSSSISSFTSVSSGTSRSSRHSIGSSVSSSSSPSSPAGHGGSGVSGSGGGAGRHLDRSVSQIEVLYNTAVQEFVRRNHGRAQASLSRLLDLLARDKERERERERAGAGPVESSLSAPSPGVAWYDLAPSSSASPSAANPSTTSTDDWTIKTLKLSISSLASLYADAPTSSTTSSRTASLDPHVLSLLPPAPADRLLTHLHAQCVRHAAPPAPSASTSSPYAPAPAPLLPPALISTLLLASLKIPSPSALAWAHGLAEEWIGALPDAFFGAVNPRAARAQGQAAAEDDTRRRVEAAREGYLKVVELFAGEVLVREGEWGMARAFLDAEGVMGSKRKEALYKHIRSAERSRAAASASSTPSSSIVLPSSSAPGSAPASASASGTASRVRSRSGSTASSESEATARPHAPGAPSSAGGTSPITRLSGRPWEMPSSTRGGLQVPSRNPTKSASTSAAAAGADAEADGDAEADAEASTTASTRSTLPSRIFVNPLASRARGTLSSSSPLRGVFGAGSGGKDSSDSGSGRGWDALLALLPPPVRARIQPLIRHPWLLAALAGLPSVLLFLAVGLVLRRRLRLRAHRRAMAQTAGVVGIGPSSRVLSQSGTGAVASPAGIGAAIAPAKRAAAAVGGGVGKEEVAQGVEALRARLRAQRQSRVRGMIEWFKTWWGWWMRRVLGVWEMGTTITYV